MPRPSRPPTYRRRIVRGRQVAYVTLRDAETGQRRDFWLGPYGTPESRAAYARLLAQWSGKRLAGGCPREADPCARPPVRRSPKSWPPTGQP